MSTSPRSRRPRRGALAAVAAVAALTMSVGASACSDADPVESPAPGGTQSPTDASNVRAPNGTNMGAPPINVGTPAP